MADIGIQTTATVPANTSILITVYEDIDGDGDAENSTTQSIEDGDNSYVLSGFDKSSGNEFWTSVERKSSDVTASPTLSSYSLSLETSITTSPGGPVTVSSQTNDAGISGSGSANASPDTPATATAATPNAGITGSGSTTTSPSGTVTASAVTPDAGISGSGTATLGTSVVSVSAALNNPSIYGSGVATATPDSPATVTAVLGDIGALMKIYAITELPAEDAPALENTADDEITVDRESAVSDNGQVRLQIRETGESTWDQNAASFTEAVIDHATLTHPFGGVVDGEEYEVRGRTETSVVTGSWSNTTSIISTIAATGAPDLSPDRYSVDLVWDDVWDNENGVRILRAVNDGEDFGSYEPVADLPAGSTTHTDATAEPARNYSYKVEAYTEHTAAASSASSTQTLQEFLCGNGGVVYVLAAYADLLDIEQNGDWVKFGDIELNASADLTLSLDGQHNITGTVKHVTGDPVAWFSISPREPNATTDFRMKNLKADEFYRLQFDGVLAKADGGRAHDKTSQNGLLQFNGVTIPDE